MVDNDVVPLLPLLLCDVPPGLPLALGQEGVAFEDWTPGPPRGRFVVFDSRRHASPPLAAGQVGIDVECLRDASCLRQQGGRRPDPLAALIDESWQFRCWPLGGFKVTERVARYDKRTLRQEVMARLRDAVERADGVWLRLAPYPFPYQSAFNFRFDHDGFQPADFKATLSAIAGYEEATSHYVCGATHERRADALARLRGLDVGSHGYWHHTYPNLDDNLRNIRRGIDVLRGAGLEPKGFVAPHGCFNRSLLFALAALGVTHSSEFALAYDEWPFLPAGAGVLQVPIHPVCLGIFLEAANRGKLSADAAAAAAAGHFRQTALAKWIAGEPIFLYGHPDGRLGRYPHVLRETLSTVAGLSGVWRTTLSQFAGWWRTRASVRWQAVRDGGQIRVVRVGPVADVGGNASDWRLAIECFRGDQVASVPLDGETQFSLDTLSWTRRPAWMPAPSQQAAPPGGLRGCLLRYLDWERVTPVEEIRPRNWRGWVKRSLRRIRERRLS